MELEKRFFRLRSQFGLDRSQYLGEGGNQELSLQRLWFEHLLPKELITTDGTRAVVEQTGFWNHGPGPDFSHAKVCWDDGRISEGSVEIHLHASDWFAHNHDKDTAYGNVILHIALHGDEPVLHKEVGSIKSVELHGQLDEEVLSLISEEWIRNKSERLPRARAGICAPVFEGMSLKKVKGVLHEAGLLRLHRKALTLSRHRLRDGDEQALWEWLAIGMGYSENKVPFRMLARVVPFSLMRKCDNDLRDALLFGASGFLPREEISSLEDDTRKYLKNLWHLWWSHSLSADEEKCGVRGWKLAPVRPPNHPHRRIGALAVVASILKDCLGMLKNGAWRKAVQLLENVKHPHFDEVYTVHSTRKSKLPKIIGSSRANQILWNIFIPWMLSNNGEWNSEWEKCPTEPENVRIRTAMERLFPGAKPQKMRFDGLCRQGLMEILENLCSRASSDCSGCPLPAALHSSGKIHGISSQEDDSLLNDANIADS